MRYAQGGGGFLRSPLQVSCRVRDVYKRQDLERASFFDILYKCFAILLTISLGFHILLLLGIKLPSLGIIQYGNMAVSYTHLKVFSL